MPNWFKTILKVIAALAVVLIILLVGVLVYINSNKAKVQKLITTELNKNLNGTLTIGKLDPVFFKGFPDISLSLRDVTLRDKRFTEHHHTLLDAQNFDVSVNASALLHGTISINHVDISNAKIDLYTDSNGYSNTQVFKKGKPKQKTTEEDSGNSAAEIRKFNLINVSLAINDQKSNKLFQFDIHELQGKANYPDSGWNAAIHLKLLTKNMAFNTDNGSFLQGKEIEANLTAGSNQDSGKINVESNRFDIGGNVFILHALFTTVGKAASFNFRLQADQLMWRGAASLLPKSINQTLYMFNLDKPIAVKATIAGNFGGGSPFLNVTAVVRNNTLTIPGGTITNCSFDGQYTNNATPGKGLTDENSVIRLHKLKGSYNHLPFMVDTGSITNLAKPIATGNFTSKFDLSNLNFLFGKVAKFTKGTADMNFHYKADVVALRLNKPVIAGVINLRNADISYVPKNLNLTNTSLSLQFIHDNLILNNIRLQSGKSIVFMEGRVNNFLNLYYDSPEKILLTWQIKSPQLYLGEFLGFLNAKQQAATKKTANSGNIIDQLGNVVDKAQADMHLQVDNLHYNKFLATNTTADLHVSEDGVILNNVSLKHAGGSLKLNGQIIQRDKINKVLFSTVVTNVNIKEFFYAFDNFGMKDITSDNLKGTLSAKTQLSGTMTNTGSLLPKTLNGYVAISLRNGALLNYNPLKTVGKIAFPFRNLNDIELPKLDARFDMHGDKIIINPMQITSSVINADIAGTYGLNGGTSIAVDIPLRNPKNDTSITDKAELQKKRYKGIVIHLLAKDDDKGKIKIGFNKDHDKKQ